MKKILLEKIELGDSGQLSKDKINNNTNKLSDAISDIDDIILKKDSVSQRLGVSPNNVPSEQAVSNALRDYAKQSDIQNIRIGIIYKGVVDNMSELYAMNPKDGDTYKVLDQIDDNGNPYYYQYTKDSGWNNTGMTALPGNIATKNEVDRIMSMLKIEGTVSDVPKIPVHTYQNKYINTAGGLSPYNGYWVNVYAVNEGDTVQIKGNSSSVGIFYVLLSAYTEDNYTKIANGPASGSGEAIDKMLVIPNGVKYVAISRAVVMYEYDWQSEIIEDMEEIRDALEGKADSGGSTKTLQDVDTDVQSIIENIGLEEVEEISPTEKTIEYTYQNKFINVFGNLQDYVPYWVRVYKVNAGDKVQIKGTSASTGKFYVLLSAYTETNYTKVLDGTPSTGGLQINETVTIPAGVNYIAVTRAAAAYDIIKVKHSRVDKLAEDVTVLQDKIVNCDGDSLTSGAGGSGLSYPRVLQLLLGEDWVVNNRGLGGENTLTIGARQGGMPMYIKNPVTIPANGSTVTIPTEVVDGVTYYGLYSLYNDAQVRPLLQAGSVLINPCVINNIECTLVWTGSNYTIKRNAVGSRNVTTPPNCLIHTSSMKNTKGVNIIFMGTNGGFDGTGKDLAEQFGKLTAFKGDGKYVVITTHVNPDASIPATVKKEFGVKHIGLREYCSTKAIYDAIDLGLLDQANYPTQADLTAMAQGNCPPSLLADSIHFNKTGYIVLGVLAYNKMVTLGYVDNPLAFDRIKEIVSEL